MIPSQRLGRLSVSDIHSTCPLCQQLEGQQSYITSGFAPTLMRSYASAGKDMHEAFFRHCSLCDFGYFYPLPDDAFFNKFYSNEANTHGQTLETLLASRPEHSQRTWTAGALVQIISFIDSHNIDREKIRKGRSVDIGCGEGDLIAHANEMGFHFEGVDPVRANCDFIEQRYKTKAFCGMLKDVPASEHGQFSLICSIHSLEHHKSPYQTLRKCYDLLHEGGVLFTSVPNLNSYAFQALPLLHPYFAFPAHVNYFSPTSMRISLSRLGFTDVDVRTTTETFQTVYCWEAAIKLGHMKPDPSFLDHLSAKDQHENLYVFAVKGASR